MDQLNLFAVVVAAVSSFVIGGLWYSPLLFQRAWMAANNFKDSDLQNANMALHVAHRAYVIEVGEIRMEGPAAELAASDEVRKAYLGA